MRTLITGIGGFAGGHLTRALLERGEEVVGFTLPGGDHPQLDPLDDRVELIHGDVSDADAVGATMSAAGPDVVVHLAAVTHVGRAWKERQRTLEVNVLGTGIVLQAAGRLDPPPRVLLASTGQVYDSRRAEVPFTEDSPLCPLNPYAASKRCAEVLAEQAWAGDGVPVVVLRTFNFTGPWQSTDFVCSDFARQVAWAEAGLREPSMSVGNLAAERDFSDVGDIVDGYLRAADRAEPGRAYNLASGRPVAISWILDHLLEMATVEIEVRQDPERLRPVDIPRLAGDASRARLELGWEPRVSLEETLASVLEFWRRRAREEAAT